MRHSRRQFLRGAVALVGLPLAAGRAIVPPWAGQPGAARVGWLSLSTLERSVGLEAFREGLRERGWAEGEALAIEFRFAAGEEERLPELAAELVSLPVDVILATSTPSAQAATQATGTVPVVFAAVADPVGSGLVASLDRPGGNATGLSYLSPRLSATRPELLRELVPGLGRAAVLSNPANPALALDWSETELAARAAGIHLELVELRGADELEGALAAVAAGHVEALVTLPDALFIDHRRRIVEFAAACRLPALYTHRPFVTAGGLMAYGPDLPDLYRRAATYVDQILRGAEPAELPVEQPSTFDLAVNLKTARALGVTIPPSVLARATEIIQ